MNNKAMERKLASGEALDLSSHQRLHVGAGQVHYTLAQYVDGKDYCDRKTERWIWSIGKRLTDGAIIASTTVDLYQNDAYECLWLR